MKKLFSMVSAVLLAAAPAGTQGVQTNAAKNDGYRAYALGSKLKKLDSCIHALEMKDRVIESLTRDLSQ